ncbi:MAG: SH3 domain-containing protein [Acidobacteria bacterium]|nr:SH3 domain-containing protein [Acidobacteriota bacterium]
MHYLAKLLFLLLFLTFGCNNLNKISEPEVLYKSITLSPQSHIYERPVARTERLESLKEGENIEILQDPKNRWLKIRTPSGKIGWIESRDVLRKEYLEEWNNLRGRIDNRQPQMKGDTLDDAYLRLRPGRDTVKVYKLLGAKILDIFDVAHTERPGANSKTDAATTPSKIVQNNDPKNSTSKKKKKSDPNSERKFDTWYLVRTPEGTVGWLYAGLVDIHVPEELAILAENKVIVSWHILTTSKDLEGKERPWYLSIEREPNSNKDFDRVRVLYWNAKKSRYDLVHRIQDINGIFPIEATRIDQGEQGQPTFKIRYLSKEDANVIVVDDYELTGTQVKKTSSITETLEIPQEQSEESTDNSSP